jgi:hypothetical protein
MDVSAGSGPGLRSRDRIPTSKRLGVAAAGIAGKHGSTPMSEPRSEPEIIPPDRGRTEWPPGPRSPWVSADAYGTRRIYVRKIGPTGVLLLALLVGTLAALIFVLLLGAFLIWIPVAILVFVAAVVGGLMRRYFLRR